MFPEETHVKILQQLDELESEVYGVYRKVERLRAGLQRQWKALPSGERWSEERHSASLFAAVSQQAAASPQSAGAVARADGRVTGDDRA